MGPVGSRRTYVVLLVVLFVAMCAAIAWSQWYAIHVNVPKYRALHEPARTP
jgi:hypothetical protein